MISLKKKYILIVLVDLYASLSRFFFCYPDPDQRFLKRIRPNDTDPKHCFLPIPLFILFKSPIPDYCWLTRRWARRCAGEPPSSPLEDGSVVPGSPSHRGWHLEKDDNCNFPRKVLGVLRGFQIKAMHGHTENWSSWTIIWQSQLYVLLSSSCQ